MNGHAPQRTQRLDGMKAVYSSLIAQSTKREIAESFF